MNRLDRLRPVALVGILLLAVTVGDARGHERTLPVKPLKQQGQACLPACGAMALSLQDPDITVRDVAREVAMYPDGTGFFDLQEALHRRGVASLTWQGDASQAACLVAHGFPVVAAVKVGRTKHAVLVHGAKWAPGGKPCGMAPESLQVIDPRSARSQTMTVKALDRWLFARQLMLVAPEGRVDLQAAESSGFPGDAVRSANRSFRAEALVRRAAAHKEPNEQAVTLLRRALAEDPCSNRAREALKQVLRHLRKEMESALPPCPRSHGAGDRGEKR